MSISESISKSRFENLPDDEKKRLGAVPEKRDLFETRLLRIGNADTSAAHILVSMRDSGNAASLLPVVRELFLKGDTISILADGMGLERFMKEGYETHELLEDTHSPLLDVINLETDVILITDTTSEQGLEHSLLYASQSPIVLMEHMYGAIEHLIQHASEDENENKKEKFVLNRLTKICMMDESSRQRLLRDYPSLEEKAVVTGQPLFDRIYNEDKEIMRSKVRQALDIHEDEKFVVFFGASSTDSLSATPNSKTALLQVVESLKGSSDKIKFVFTNHPRDTVTEKEYQAILSVLDDKALLIAEAKKFDSDYLQAGADVVVSLPSSTTTYDAIYRRKPIIILTENRGEHIIPALDTGSAMELTDARLFATALSDLLGADTIRAETMKKNQEKNYPLDGKNADRVVEVVESIIKSSRHPV